MDINYIISKSSPFNWGIIRLNFHCPLATSKTENRGKQIRHVYYSHLCEISSNSLMCSDGVKCITKIVEVSSCH